MQAKVIGSGSKGNSYLLTASDGETLIIELGLRFADIKKTLNFDLSKVTSTWVSHQHLDHSKGMREAANAGLDIYCLKETAEAMGFNNHRIKHVEPLKNYQVGSFKVKPFSLQHDVPIIGLLIHHPEMGNCLYISDTCFCEYRFPEINNMLLEANYCSEILAEKTAAGTIHNFLRNRILASHMSFQTTKEFLMANDLSKVSSILLIHLSDSNADAKRFKEETKALTNCNVEIAQKGVVMDMNLTPW